VNPHCPNCDRPMIPIARSRRSGDPNTFECRGCGLVYMTEDQIPVPGKSRASRDTRSGA
jgi:hypothetical protein